MLEQAKNNQEFLAQIISEVKTDALQINEMLKDSEKLKKIQDFMSDINTFITDNANFVGPSGEKEMEVWDMHLHLRGAAGDAGDSYGLSVKKGGKEILSYEYSSDMFYKETGNTRPVNMKLTTNGKVLYYNGNTDKEEDGHTKWIFENYDVLTSAQTYVQEIKDAIPQKGELQK